MKKKMQKMSLNRETLYSLEKLGGVMGGLIGPTQTPRCTAGGTTTTTGGDTYGYCPNTYENCSNTCATGGACPSEYC